jgi:hypothetical protein
LTPLERPAEFAGKQFLSDADVERIVRQSAARHTEENGPAPLPRGSVGGYNQFWYEPGRAVVPDRRTSLIVDPPDGRLPPLTDKGKTIAEAHRELLRRSATGPEDRDASERCILGYNAGPPMVPGGYNQLVQLVQTRDYLLIHNEMVHNARIVPLDGRSRLAGHLRPWNGDSRGRWEGDTLVVETANFTDKVWNQFNRWNMASDENLRLVERFTRIDLDTMRYEFTVEDPTIWTRPFTAVVPMRKSQERMYEYACHEGNHGMYGILKGARAMEVAADEAAKK